MNKEMYYVRWKLNRAIADLNYSLECFGDKLSEQESYPSDIYGFDAIYLYLSNKHGWTIDHCKAMDKGDIRLALAVEMKGWKLPPDARFGNPSPEGVTVVIERE